MKGRRRARARCYFHRLSRRSVVIYLRAWWLTLCALRNGKLAPFYAYTSFFSDCQWHYYLQIPMQQSRPYGFNNGKANRFTQYQINTKIDVRSMVSTFSDLSKRFAFFFGAHAQQPRFIDFLLYQDGDLGNCNQRKLFGGHPQSESPLLLWLL